jgi:hypothetical protein
MPEDRIIRQPIAVSLPVHTDVKALALAEGTSMAQIVARAVRMYQAALMSEGVEAQT